MKNYVSLVACVIAALALASSATAQRIEKGEQSKTDLSPQQVKIMKEFAKAQLEAAFTHSDKDDDGFLTKEELREFQQFGQEMKAQSQPNRADTRRARRAQARVASTTPQVKLTEEQRKELEAKQEKQLEAAFKSMDSNEDGQLAKDELFAAALASWPTFEDEETEETGKEGDKRKKEQDKSSR